MMKISMAVVFFTVLFGASSPSFPGDVDSPGDPLDGSGMPRLEDLYQYLIYGTLWEDPGRFQEPGSGPGSTGHNLKEIYDDVRSDFIHCDATPDQVVSGATYFSTTGGTWGPTAGAAPNIGQQNITPGATSQPITRGFHDGSGKVAGDSDLTSGNIVKGVRIFDVTGSYECPFDCVGTANTGDVLAGRTFSNDASAGLTGSMPNNNDFSLTCGAIDQSVAAGYYSGGTLSGDADLVSDNIVASVEIFGVPGAAVVATGEASDGDVLSGVSYSSASGGSIGSMPDREGDNASTSREASGGMNYFTAPNGYYDGDDRVSAADGEVAALDGDLTSGAIHAGVTIFGVVGNANVVNTSSGDAAAGEILDGKKAWVDGEEVSGTMPTRTLSAGSDMVNAGYYAATTLRAEDADLAAGNIRLGIDIFGIDGDLAPGGTAAAGDVFNGRTAHLSGDWILDAGALDLACNTATFDGSGNKVANEYDGADGDGENRWCMTDSGDAASADIASGKKAWVDGVEVTGAAVAGSDVNGPEGRKSFTIPDGIYSGARTATANDADLLSENIKFGVTLFGIVGSMYGDPDDSSVSSFDLTAPPADFPQVDMQVFYIDENLVNTQVKDATGNDAVIVAADTKDAPEELTYSIVDDMSFSIGGSDNNALVTSAALDYENRNVYSFIIRVTDTDGNATDQIVQVRVNNVEEGGHGSMNNDVLNPLPDKTFSSGETWIYKFPEDAFKNHQDIIGYSAGLAGGGPMPGFLNFSSSDRSFSASAGKAIPNTYAIKVTAAYSSGAPPTITAAPFDITITP